MPLPTDEAKKIRELEARLSRISTENDRLKRIIAEKNSGRRPIPGYTYTYSGEKISDEQVIEFIMEEISGDCYPYGYKKLTSSMQEDYKSNINHKKVYRLCKELDILPPQRKIIPKHPRKLAKKTKVTGPISSGRWISNMAT